MGKIAGFESLGNTLSFPAGTTIFRESDPSDCMYVIESGIVEVSVKGKVLLTLRGGEIFGESALIDATPRVATAVARSDCRLLPLDQEGFKQQVRKNPEFALQVMRIVVSRVAALSSVRIDSRVLEQFARPSLAVPEPITEALPDPDLRSEHARVFLLSRMSLFSQLEREELKRLAGMVSIREYKASQPVVRSGDAGSSMFLVARGRVAVLIQEPQTKEELRVAELGAGEFFGEMSLLTSEPRSATIVASSDVVLYEISKSSMEELFGQRPEVFEIVSWILARRRQQNFNNLQKALQEHASEQEVLMAREQILARLRETFEKKES